VNNSGTFGSIDGQVTLFGETDSAGINVSLLEIGSSVSTDSSGNFVMSNVPKGTYTISASFSPPYQPKQRTGVSVTGSGTSKVAPFSLKIGKLLTNNQNITTTTAYNGIEITPDMTKIIYVTQDGSLYSQPSDGSSAPILIGSGVTGSGYGGLVYSFFYQITPDSSRILFLKGPTGGPYNLYSTSVSTGSPLLIDSGINQSYQITPDSSRVVYTKGGYSGVSIYSSPIINSSPVQIDTGIQWFALSPDLSRVVYQKSSSNYSNLYSSPISSSSPIVIDTGVLLNSFQIAPNSVTVVYMKLLTTPYSACWLYSSSINNSSFPLQLAMTDYDYCYSSWYRITPDSSRIVYVFNGLALYSTPINSSSPMLIDTGVFPDVNILQISPDSGYVVYPKGTYPGPYDLYSSPVGSSFTVEIDTGVSDMMMYIQPSPSATLFTPDSSRIVYVKGSTGGPYDLYTSPVSSSSPTHIDTGINFYQITPNSSRIVYEKNVSGITYNIYSSPISSSSPIQVDTGTDGFFMTPDGSKVVYCKNGVSPVGPADLYFRIIDASKNAHEFDDYGYSCNWGCVHINAVSADGSFFIYNRYTNLSPQNLDNGIFRVDFPAGW